MERDGERSASLRHIKDDKSEFRRSGRGSAHLHKSLKKLAAVKGPQLAQGISLDAVIAEAVRKPMRPMDPRPNKEDGLAVIEGLAHLDESEQAHHDETEAERHVELD